MAQIVQYVVVQSVAIRWLCRCCECEVLEFDCNADDLSSAEGKSLTGLDDEVWEFDP